MNTQPNKYIAKHFKKSWSTWLIIIDGIGWHIILISIVSSQIQVLNLV